MATDNEDIPFTVSDPLWVDGIPYHRGVTEEIIRKLPDLPVYEDDIYIAGYVKSGAHWLATTVEAIMRSDNLEDYITKGKLYNSAPIEILEGNETHLDANITRPRIALTMMRFKYLPSGILEGKAKVIHISRNPRDVAVSYLHFTNIYPEDYNMHSESWDSFFKSFMAGHVPRGKWYDYMIDWMKHRDAPNILFIKYEDYIHNPVGTVKQIADFLGKTLREETARKIGEILSFKSMKSNQNLAMKHESLQGDFMRKGVVGDWENYFTPKQVQIMDEMYQKFKAETGIEFNFK